MIRHRVADTWLLVRGRGRERAASETIDVPLAWRGLLREVEELRGWGGQASESCLLPSERPVVTNDAGRRGSGRPGLLGWFWHRGARSDGNQECERCTRRLDSGRAAGEQAGRESFIGRRGQQRHVERRRTAKDVASLRSSWIPGGSFT